MSIVHSESNVLQGTLLFFNTNNFGLQYVAIYVPLDTEGWAEMAAITASVTDVGMLDDPTPRIDVHKKNKL